MPKRRILHAELDGPVVSLECLEDRVLLQEVSVDGLCRCERRGTSTGGDPPVQQGEDLAAHIVVERERRVCVDPVALLMGNL